MKMIRNGILAGFIATVAVTMMMMIKTASKQFPELHVVRTLSDVIGTPDNLMIGFGVHLLIGTLVWGIAFALLESRLPTWSYMVKGTMFGILAWLLMMLIFMPLAGAGLFAVHRGTMMVPLVTLLYHLVFGLVLGSAYGWYAPSVKRAKNNIVRNSS